MKTRAALLITGACFCLSAIAEPADSVAADQITTLSGKTYNHVTVLRGDPDGMLVQYDPDGIGGIGYAKVKFSDLPESWRAQYGYSPEKASEFEQRQAQATVQWRAPQRLELSPSERFEAIALLNRSLAGDAFSSYSVTLNADGSVTAQGFTGSPPRYEYPYGYNYGYNNNVYPPLTSTAPEMPPAQDYRAALARH